MSRFSTRMNQFFRSKFLFFHFVFEGCETFLSLDPKRHWLCMKMFKTQPKVHRGLQIVTIKFFVNPFLLCVFWRMQSFFFLYIQDGMRFLFQFRFLVTTKIVSMHHLRGTKSNKISLKTTKSQVQGLHRFDPKCKFDPRDAPQTRGFTSHTKTFQKAI